MGSFADKIASTDIKKRPVDALTEEDKSKADSEAMVRELLQDDDRVRQAVEMRKADIESEYSSSKDNVKKQQAIEMLINSLGKLGAARQGAKTGVDMSGLDMGVQDREPELARIEARRSADMGELSSTRKRLGDLVEARRKSAADKPMQDRKLAIEERGMAAREEELRIQSLRLAKEAKDSGQGMIMKSRDDIVRVLPDGTVETLHKGRSTDISEKSLAHRMREQDELSPAMLGLVSGYDEATALLSKARKQKVDLGIDTGPIANVRNYLASTVGVDDPKVSVLKQDLLDTLASKIKTLSGTAASEGEAKRLQFTLPSLSDNDEQFLAKLDNAVVNLELAKEERLKVLGKGGRDVTPFTKESQSGSVRMTFPDGSVRNVPADKVEKAKSVGAK